MSFFCCAGLGWHFGWLHVLSVSWAPAFIGNLITADAIFVAYLFGVIAILPAVSDKTIVQKFKEWGWFVQLVGYLRSAVWSALFVLALSLATYAISPQLKASAKIDGIFSAIWWGSLGFVTLAVVRATSIMLKLLTAR
jgi:hypothetical protein